MLVNGREIAFTPEEEALIRRGMRARGLSVEETLKWFEEILAAHREFAGIVGDYAVAELAVQDATAASVGQEQESEGSDGRIQN